MSSICTYYLRGSCRFGVRCWNSHDLESVRSNSPYQILESTDDEESFPERGSTSNIFIPSPSSSANRGERQRHQVPNPAKKVQTNKTEPEAMWAITNKSSGETREGSPDSMLVEAVKKLNEAENTIKTLHQQLRSKNDGENFSWIEHQIEQSMENDLQCNICYEIFIKPTVLNCSHTFCHECIESWTRRVNHCPTCRVYVKNKSYCLTLDTFLDKMSDCLPEEIKSRREALKLERTTNSRAEAAGSRNRRNNNPRRRNNRNQSLRRTLGVLWGERDHDGAEWNIALEEALFDPIRLGDVLGRHRNDRNDREEWEDDLSDTSMDSSSEHNHFFCTYCDNFGHSASNCPLFIMDEDFDDVLW